MNSRTLVGALVGTLAVVGGALAAGDAAAAVSWKELGRNLVVKGSLGRPLGTVVTIQGAVLAEDARRSKADLGKTLLQVEVIDDAPLPKPVVVELRKGPGGVAPKLVPGQRFAIRGYESGGFVGVPAEAFEHAPAVTATEFHFAVWFLPVEELPVEPSGEPGVEPSGEPGGDRPAPRGR